MHPTTHSVAAAAAGAFFFHHPSPSHSSSPPQQQQRQHHPHPQQQLHIPTHNNNNTYTIHHSLHPTTTAPSSMLQLQQQQPRTSNNRQTRHTRKQTRQARRQQSRQNSHGPFTTEYTKRRLVQACLARVKEGRKGLLAKLRQRVHSASAAAKNGTTATHATHATSPLSRRSSSSCPNTASLLLHQTPQQQQPSKNNCCDALQASLHAIIRDEKQRIDRRYSLTGTYDQPNNSSSSSMRQQFHLDSTSNSAQPAGSTSVAARPRQQLSYNATSLAATYPNPNYAPAPHAATAWLLTHEQELELLLCIEREIYAELEAEEAEKYAQEMTLYEQSMAEDAMVASMTRAAVLSHVSSSQQSYNEREHAHAAMDDTDTSHRIVMQQQQQSGSATTAGAATMEEEQVLCPICLRRPMQTISNGVNILFVCHGGDMRLEVPLARCPSAGTLRQCLADSFQIHASGGASRGQNVQSHGVCYRRPLFRIANNGSALVALCDACSFNHIVVS